MGYKGHKMNTNTYTPSKELLRAITCDKVSWIDTTKTKDTKELEYATKYGCLMIKINIYELAIKTKQAYPDIDLNLAATDISEFWRQANELVRGANNV